MVARLAKTQGGYIIALTEEMVEELCLADGAAVEVRAAAENADGSTVAAGPEIAYVSPVEALEWYERSKVKYGRAYEALAK